eukprot:COSAG06_NODE_9108_length_1984_cov_1.694960_3_plen_55_part_00
MLRECSSYHALFLVVTQHCVRQHVLDHLLYLPVDGHAQNTRDHLRKPKKNTTNI